MDPQIQSAYQDYESAKQAAHDARAAADQADKQLAQARDKYDNLVRESINPNGGNPAAGGRTRGRK